MRTIPFRDLKEISFRSFIFGEKKRLQDVFEIEAHKDNVFLIGSLMFKIHFCSAQFMILEQIFLYSTGVNLRFPKLKTIMI